MGSKSCTHFAFEVKGISHSKLAISYKGGVDIFFIPSEEGGDVS